MRAVYRLALPGDLGGFERGLGAHQGARCDLLVPERARGVQFRLSAADHLS
jgi:hypothetical protein